MKHLIYSMVGLFCLVQPAQAQPFTYHWATDIGGRTQYNGQVDMVYSDFGQLYITGDFTGTQAFGAANKTAVGYSDMYVTLVDTSGNVQWTVTGGAFLSYAYATAITRDLSNNIYVVGHFVNSFTLGTFTVNTLGQNDIFIAKLDFQGIPVWLKRAGGASFDEAGAIHCDGQFLYLTGHFTNAASFDAVNLTSSGTNDQEIFIAKYDLNGSCQWAKSAGGTGEDHGGSIIRDASGHIGVCGHFSDVATFGTNTVTSAAFFDIFVARYDGNGNNLWVTRAGGVSNDLGLAMGFDKSGNYYVAGNIGNTALFGPYQVIDNGYGNIYLAKVDSTGAFQWAKGGGSPFGDGLFDLSVNRNDGNCYLTGFASGSASFGSVSVPNNGLNDVFILRYDNAGTPIFALNIGGSNYDLGKSITADEGGGVIYVAGEYTDMVSVGANALPVPPPGTWHQFVARIATGTVGVPEAGPAAGTVRLWPNPAQDHIEAALDGDVYGPAHITVTDALGRVVYTADRVLDGRTVVLPVSTLDAGRYTCVVRTGKGESHKGFVVVD